MEIAFCVGVEVVMSECLALIDVSQGMGSEEAEDSMLQTRFECMIYVVDVLVVEAKFSVNSVEDRTVVVNVVVVLNSGVL
jgi:hypothetical protein